MNFNLHCYIGFLVLFLQSDESLALLTKRSHVPLSKLSQINHRHLFGKSKSTNGNDRLLQIRNNALLGASTTSAMLDADVKKIFKMKKIESRRPQVESGLRYRSDDWFRNFLSIPFSFVLRRISFHLTTNTILCALVILLHKVPKFPKLQIPLVGHTLMGGIMSLLLVFRTNSAYARFWEARGVWSKTLSTCRNLALSIMAHIRPHSPQSAKRFMELLSVFPNALCYSCLCGNAELSTDVKQVLEKYQSKSALTSDSSLEPAMVISYLMHQTLHDAAIESSSSSKDFVEAIHLTEMTHEINYLVDALSTCQKIARTPVPLSYSRHTSRLLTLWTGTLPFALIGQLGYLTLPVLVTACFFLLGIEEIGHLIEQPFVGDRVAEQADRSEELGLEYDKSEVKKLSPLMRRAAKTKPWDIGLPICSMAEGMRKEVKEIESLAQSATISPTI
mmetsp:Transcript_12285/g.18845  ORF Transcript_12285/g.18845 Transcript_12285/m.18845 type:complete len:447 (+) Transcript_12285:107-1447(+)|eukprot:CAMPEP_0178916524 /NCGR_PEP_ID=MMETSP0786-20121207/12697_1 /TAXON_ID=186022 /ORGANISM="Thalassionema frauenfeldii, Strain CCMP 1798" /LENGTH=446 /DNA_ID=CAMNT_0020589889 /DNA_START=83 /DNA_END=1423 /DNA_ORIENTATION=+